MEGFDQQDELLLKTANNKELEKNVKPIIVGSVDGIYQFHAEDDPSIRGSAIKNNPMCGITFGGLLKLLWVKEADHVLKRGHGIDWQNYSHRVMGLILLSIFNSILAAWERIYIRIFLWKHMMAAKNDKQDPVFILGHPRTGTTMLHSLLALDTDRFCVCSTFAAGFPTSFLSFESIGKQFLASVLTPTRPMDNMPLHFDLPQEDELATMLLLLGGGGRGGKTYSPYLSLYFMKDEEKYRPYQSLRETVVPSKKEISEWVRCFQDLCTKLKCRDIVMQQEQQRQKKKKEKTIENTEKSNNNDVHSGPLLWDKAALGIVKDVWKFFTENYYDFSDTRHDEKNNNNSKEKLFPRPSRLLLKSPCHTGRAELLLRLFPTAKFVYLHRDPFEVFLSSAHMASTTYGYMFLQSPTDEELQEYILRQGEILVGEYQRCKDIGILNEENLVELSFEELTNNPLEAVSRVYTRLGLVESSSEQPPPFPLESSSSSSSLSSSGLSKEEEESFLTRLHDHVAKLKTYKRNTFSHVSLDNKLKEIIRTRWKTHFHGFGYSSSSNTTTMENNNENDHHHNIEGDETKKNR